MTYIIIQGGIIMSNKSKMTKRFVVGGTAVALAVTAIGVGVCINNPQAANCDIDEYKNDNVECSEVVVSKDIVTELEQDISIQEKDVYKDETVYAFCDASGNTDKILVSEHLSNKNGQSKLVDKTDLKDIVILKGDHEFTQNGDTITWDANGEDIYYQGVSNKKIPVDVKVTYYLDGKEIAPDMLAGKSGRVKIRFDYTNNASVKEDVNGKKEDVNIPFIAVSGMILGDNFSNVTVENGKVLSEGNSNVVIGYGMPGMAENLNLSDKDMKGEFNIPDYFEVEADVDCFELDMTATLVMNASSIELNQNIDLSKLDELITSLSTAGGQLVEGTETLSQGMGTLYENMGIFDAGVYTLNSGLNSLAIGAGNIYDGIVALNSGANGVCDGIASLDTALNTPMTDDEKTYIKTQAQNSVGQQFAEGTDTYNYIYNQAAQSFTAAMTSDTTIDAIYGGLYSNLHDTLYNASVAQLAQQYQRTPEEVVAAMGNDIEVQIQSNLYQLATGIAGGIAQSGADNMGKNVVAACSQAAGQAAGEAAVFGVENTKKKIATEIETVQDNGYSLVTGSNAVALGTDTLVSVMPNFAEGISNLVSGSETLTSGSAQLVTGAEQLADGAETLNKGMVQFNDEAIQTIIGAYNGDIKNVIAKWEAVMQAATEYDTFTALNDNDTGCTKFIIKTEGITAR